MRKEACFSTQLVCRLLERGRENKEEQASEKQLRGSVRLMGIEALAVSRGMKIHGCNCRTIDTAQRFALKLTLVRPPPLVI